MSTKIEWTDETWNPITGCTPTSEGCQNCYAKRMATRLRGRYGYPKDNPFKVTFHPDRLAQPLKWKKPRRIFVCSMGDLFHKSVPNLTIDLIWEKMKKCPKHTFLILTKRPERLLKDYDNSDPLPNVWLGVTAENQARADERIPMLLQIPAAVRFVSLEPLLGPVDFTDRPLDPESTMGEWSDLDQLNWVIVGGESGPGARRMRIDWVRSVRDQCQEAGVPFFFKQMKQMQIRGKLIKMPKLDGRVWDEMPTIPALAS